MAKLNRMNVFFWTQVCCLFVGIVFSMVFQFTGSSACLLVGLAFFACGFLIMALSEISELIVLKATLIEEEAPEQIEQKKKELYNKKLLAVVKMILAIGMAAFVLVVMFLF